MSNSQMNNSLIGIVPFLIHKNQRKIAKNLKLTLHPISSLPYYCMKALKSNHSKSNSYHITKWEKECK